MTQNSSEIPKADIFWDARYWYWVDVTKNECENSGNSRIHDAIVAAIRNGYEISGVRGTRGSVKVKGMYK